MVTKTIRSRFNHEIGQQVEGCTILEKKVVIPAAPAERRLGVYDYLVEVPPAPPKPARQKSPAATTAKSSRPAAPAEHGTFTRATPEEVGGVIRRIPQR